MLLALTLLFLWGCEKDVQTSIDADQQLDIRARGGNGNGKGEGGSGTLYGVMLNNGPFTSQASYGHAGTSNKKKDNLGTKDCSGEFLMSGMTSQIGECFDRLEINRCATFMGLTWDKRTKEITLRVGEFQDNSGGYPNYHEVIMKGVYDEDSLYPEGENTIEIVFNTWVFHGSGECAIEQPQSFDPGSQTLIIWVEGEGPCPTPTSCEEPLN